MPGPWIPGNRSEVTLADKLVDWSAFASLGGDELVRGKDVLDIGPWIGLDALMFAPKARNYWVVDTSHEVLAWVRRVCPSASTSECSVCAMTFQACIFDTVLDFSSIDDAPDPDAAYREVARVLRPSGVFVSSYANRRVLGVQTEYTTQDPIALRAKLSSYGFDILASWHTDEPRAVMAARRV